MSLRLTRRTAVAVAALVILPVLPALATSSPVGAAEATPGGWVSAGPGRQVEVRASGLSRASTVGATAVERSGASLRASAVTGGIRPRFTGGTAEQRASFVRAANTWAGLISSRVPIVIDVEFTRFDEPDVLGSAGPSTFGLLSESGRSFYPVALANAIQGRDNNGSDPEIEALFSNDPNTFYFGTGPVPAGRYDFQTVALHEIAHGLGFIGNIEVDPVDPARGGWDYEGRTINQERLPFIFDRYASGAAPSPAQGLVTMGNDTPAIAGALTSGRTVWSGGNATGVNPCNVKNPELFTPGDSSDDFLPGTSYNHLDESAYPPRHPSSLMTPFINAQEVIRSPGPVTLGMFRDIGWATTPQPPGGLTICAPAAVNPGSTVVVKGSTGGSQVVQVYFRRRGETRFTLRRTLRSTPSGNFSTSFVGVDDHRFYAVSGGRTSAQLLTQIVPTIEGGAVRAVKAGTTVGTGGRAVANSVVTLRYRTAASAPGTFPIVRRVRANASGRWSRPLLVDRDYRFYIVGPSGRASGTVLWQAR